MSCSDTIIAYSDTLKMMNVLILRDLFFVKLNFSMTSTESKTIVSVEKRKMKSGFSSIVGKISHLQYSLEVRTTKFGEFERNARLHAPILAALTGNSGVALAGMNMNSYYRDHRGKLYWNEIKINEETFKGWLGGVFFKYNDEVELIIRGNKIIAVHDPSKRIIAFDPIYGSGLRLDLEYKTLLYCFIGMLLFLLLSSGIALFFITDDFEEFIHLVLFIFPVTVVFSLLFSFGVNRVGFFHALRKQKALFALGFSKEQDLVQKIYYDDPKFGKAQEMFGAIYSY